MRLGPGLSFSWSRAIGLAAYKARISRRIGIPLTQSGRERKIGRMVIGAATAGVLFLLGLIGVAHPAGMAERCITKRGVCELYARQSVGSRCACFIDGAMRQGSAIP